MVELETSLVSVETLARALEFVYISPENSENLERAKGIVHFEKWCTLDSA